jgi:Mn2+/Fe2+ NRAMP family transporter
MQVSSSTQHVVPGCYSTDGTQTKAAAQHLKQPTWDHLLDLVSHGLLALSIVAMASANTTHASSTGVSCAHACVSCAVRVVVTGACPHHAHAVAWLDASAHVVLVGTCRQDGVGNCLLKDQVGI